MTVKHFDRAGPSTGKQIRPALHQSAAERLVVVSTFLRCFETHAQIGARKGQWDPSYCLSRFSGVHSIRLCATMYVRTITTKAARPSRAQINQHTVVRKDACMNSHAHARLRAVQGGTRPRGLHPRTGCNPLSEIDSAGHGSRTRPFHDLLMLRRRDAVKRIPKCQYSKPNPTCMLQSITP